MKTVLYAGTFDPPTNGHLDIARRASRLFGRVVMAVADNPEKKPLFSLDERMELIRPNLPEDGPIELRGFRTLLVDFAREVGANAILRGIRAVSDFEFEFQMTHINRHLDHELETVFLMPTEDHFYTSSSLIKQVACYGGDVSALVPPNVHDALRARYQS